MWATDAEKIFTYIMAVDFADPCKPLIPREVPHECYPDRSTYCIIHFFEIKIDVSMTSHGMLSCTFLPLLEKGGSCRNRVRVFFIECLDDLLQGGLFSLCASSA